MDSYITILNKFKIAYQSVILTFDPITNKKVCFHPLKWQNTTYKQSKYNNKKNALIQITGNNSNIFALDIDGLENKTNQLLVKMCIDTCKFYNKTRKGYHFIFKYTDDFPKCKAYKYINDNNNSGFDIKSTNGCIYYGTYYIDKIPIKYENIKDEDIVPMPKDLIHKLYELLQMKNNKISKHKNNTLQTTISDSDNDNDNDNDNTEAKFPNTTLISITILDTLLSCLKPTHFSNYNEWFIIAFFIKHINSTIHALEVFIKYSKLIKEYENTPYEEYLTKWNTIKYDYTFDVIGLFFMARNNNLKLFNTIKFEHIGLLSNFFEPIIIDSQFLNYDTIANYHLDNKIIAIKSTYGSGKTQILSKLFDEYYNDKRILFITSRVTLSYSLLKSFPKFTHYQDIKGDFTQCDKLIIQLDSLHKLTKTPITNFINHNCINSQLQDYINNIPDLKYDIIALDECESLLNHLSFSQLNTENIYNILKTLCDNTDKIIALDCDFNDRSYTFLSSIFNSVSMVKPLVIENIYRHPPKDFVFTNNRTIFDTNISNDLEENLNIVIISLTQKDSEYYYKLYKDKYTTIIHNSLQNDKTQLININEYWKSARLLIYTSTIEAGCDFNIEWFDKCYIIISDKTASPRSLMQMIHRVRNYKSNIINVFNNGVAFSEFNFPYTYEEVKNHSFNTLCNSSGSLNILNSILCYNKVEEINKYYFITVFTNMIREKGSNYKYIKIDNPKNKKVVNNIYDEINNAVNIENVEDYHKYINNIRKSLGNIEDLREYGMSIKKYLLYKIWNVKPVLMDFEWIKKHYTHTKKLLNYKKFINYLVIKAYNAKHHNINKKITYIQTILSKFGIVHEDDFKFSIDAGLTMEGKKINKKDNPNIIDAVKYTEISKDISKIILTNDFRQVFDLPKLKSKVISAKAILECIKSVIGDYGFEINIISNKLHYYEEGKRITKRENKYYIDLIPSIIDVYNRELFCLIDESIELDF